MTHSIPPTPDYFVPFAAPPGDFPPEYTPNWGILQLLVPMLRPIDPATGVDTSDKLFGIVRPGGGCNDLAISGHMVVAVLTACAWHVSDLHLFLVPVLSQIDQIKVSNNNLPILRQQSYGHLQPLTIQMYITTVLCH